MRYLIIVFALISPNLVHSACIDKYDRSKLYPTWSSTPDKYKNVREQVIANHVFSGLELTKGKVTGGLLLDEYTGDLLSVGVDNIHMEHIVSLRFAHANGADCWPSSLRKQFANDPLNLLPVSAGANLRKGWDLFDYLPPKLGYCTHYLARIAAIYDKYPLTMTKRQLSRYELLEQKCEEVRAGIKIKKQSSWFRSLACPIM